MTSTQIVDPDELYPYSPFDVDQINHYVEASDLSYRAEVTVENGDHVRAQVAAARAVTHAVLALVDVITHATAGRCPCSCRATSKGSEGK